MEFKKKKTPVIEQVLKKREEKKVKKKSILRGDYDFDKDVIHRLIISIFSKIFDDNIR